MKKITSLILAVVIIFSGVTVFADSTASNKMQDALIRVKQKIDIPKEYTEFTPYSSQQNDETNYSFLWQTTEGNAHIEVSADAEGRILHYYSYDNSLKSDKKLTILSKDEIISIAESFLKKIAPEAFANNNDRLVYDEASWYVNNLSYQLTFKRYRDGIEVKDNNASVNIKVYNDKAYIRNAYINFNYKAEFNDAVNVIDDYVSKYKAAFPIELIYKDEYWGYNPKKEDNSNNVALVYRYKNNEAGYILAESGETVTEDIMDRIYFESSGAVAEDSINSARKEMLTEQEIKELDLVEGVISKADAELILKKLPYINFDKTLEFDYYNINKSNEKYYVSLSYKNNNNRYLSVTADGATGEILNLYNRAYHKYNKETELSDAQKNDANKKIDEFLKFATGEKLRNYEQQSENVSNWGVSRNFDRIVNGIRYIDDHIYVEFDNDANQITSYRLDYEDKDFKDAHNVIDNATAYDKILNISPLKKVYIQTDGIYNVCFTVTEQIMLDGVSGEKYLDGASEKPEEFKYSDIEDHWAKEKINKLAEIQIGFEGEKFNPDNPITQYDLLRLFGAGIRYKSYLDMDKDSLYDTLINESILTDAEKSPDSEVKRETACVYMIRFGGFEEVAKLNDIYKVKYADAHLISQEKIGYPAILTGMGVICGSGGKLRPTESITRAEAAVMLYNYMVK